MNFDVVKELEIADKSGLTGVDLAVHTIRTLSIALNDEKVFQALDPIYPKLRLRAYGKR